MEFWIVQTGEPIPELEPAERKWRCGILCEELVRQGHKVVWWAQNFNHRSKRFWFEKQHRLESNLGYEVELLPAIRYERNISVNRYRSQKHVARAFAIEAHKRKRPDLIFCGLPTIELCEVVASYAKEQYIPYVIDVRDPWPDVYIAACPSPFRPLAKVFFARDRKKVISAVQSCSAITAVSKTYLDWARDIGKIPANNYDGVFSLGFEGTGQIHRDSPEAQAFRDKYNLPTNAVYFCFIGSFGASYDLGVLLKAARLAQQDGHKEIAFIIAGDGEKAEKIKAQAAHLDNVHLTGWLNKEELQIAKAISIAGLATYSNCAKQSLPNKPFEYMAASLPIISSLRGELESILDEHGIGYTYQAGDAEDLYLQLLRIVDDREQTQAMSANAAKLFKTKYEIQQIYPDLAKYLSKIAAMGESVPKSASPRVL